MDQRILQGADDRPLCFLMVQSLDHRAPATGLAPTVRLSKNGEPFAAPSGAVSELGHGWYQVAPHAGDADTLGPLVLHAEAAGADPCDALLFVVPSYSAGPYYQGNVSAPLVWLQVLASDHITGAAGVSPSVLLCAPGNPFVPAAGVVAEIGFGWYKLRPSAADVAVAGPLKLNATAAGADPHDTEFDILPQGAASGSTSSGAPTSVLTAIVKAAMGVVGATGLFGARNVFATLELNDPENFVRASGPFVAVKPSVNRIKPAQYSGAGTNLAGYDGELVVRVASRLLRDSAGRDDFALLIAETGLVDLACAVAAALDGVFPEDEAGNFLTQVELRVTQMDAPGSFLTAKERLRDWRFIDLHLPMQWTMAVPPKV